jgi:hypothetical protein
MFLDQDAYGYYRHCIQCGFLHDLRAEEVRRLLGLPPAAVAEAAALQPVRREEPVPMGSFSPR